MHRGYIKLGLAMGLLALTIQTVQAQEFARRNLFSGDFERNRASFSRALDGLASQMRQDYHEATLKKAKEIAMTSIPSEIVSAATRAPQIFSQTPGGSGGGGGFGAFGGGFGAGSNFGLGGLDSNDAGIGLASSVGPNDTFFGPFFGTRSSTLRPNGFGGPVSGQASPPGRTVVDGQILRRGDSTFSSTRTNSGTAGSNDTSNPDGTFNSSSNNYESYNDGNYNSSYSRSYQGSDGTQRFSTWSMTGNAPGTVAGPGMQGTPSYGTTQTGAGQFAGGAGGGGGGGPM